MKSELNLIKEFALFSLPNTHNPLYIKEKWLGPESNRRFDSSACKIDAYRDVEAS